MQKKESQGKNAEDKVGNEENRNRTFRLEFISMTLCWAGLAVANDKIAAQVN